MEIKKGYIEIPATKFLYWYSKLIGLKGKAKMAAAFPFIFVRSDINPNLKKFGINHELIHFAQQKEMLIVGLGVVSLIENIYYRLLKRKSKWDSYLLHSYEQEAYDNMYNLEYLSKRKHYTHLKKYIKNKPVTWSSKVKKDFEVEGFPIIYECRNEPNTTYPPHTPRGKVCWHILRGSLTFSGDINQKASTGEKIIIAGGIEYSVVVGSKGCRYVVAQEIDEDAPMYKRSL